MLGFQRIVLAFYKVNVYEINNEAHDCSEVILMVHLLIEGLLFPVSGDAEKQ